MSEAILEHANLTVSSAQKSADLFCRIFDWNIRWKGDSIHDGKSIHVGGENSYLALYENPDKNTAATESYYQINGLNHVCLMVDDLDDVEQRVKKEGLEPFSHADYEPGRRFYFYTQEGLEVEVVSYANSGAVS